MAADGEAPGWDAIDAAFARLYPGQESPHHWGTDIATRVQFGGPEAIDGFSAYAATEPEPHWHWVTFGLTELYAKHSDDPERSGWGYELTMRVPRRGDDEPGTWPIQVLKPLANWAHGSRRVLEPGDWFDTGRSIAPEHPACELTAVGFVEDPQLPALDTPHGRVEFVALIGLHPRELDSVRERGVEELARARSYTGEFNVLDREPFVS